MIDFVRHPQIALDRPSFDPAVHKAVYPFNYELIFSKIAKGELPDIPTYRQLILSDLFFLIYFGMKVQKMNHPFIVNQCKMLQTGPKSDTLDVWSRFHGKSLCITTAETLQFHLDDGKSPGTNFYGYNGRESCTGILSYARPAAKKFLRAIKTFCEESDFLKACFPDVLWDNPSQQAPKWAEDEGLIFKRQTAARGEATIEAYGLTEGSPTGRHYERVVFDDIETEDIARSPKMLEDVFSKFEMTVYNLGTGSDRDMRRVIGTYYSFKGPVKRIADKKFPDGRSMFELRTFAATDNGKIDGNPVFMDKETWERVKLSKHVNSQQLCNPLPEEDIVLDSNLLKPIEAEFLPRDRFKFLIIDQAGDSELNKTQGDVWAIGVVSIVPYEWDDKNERKLSDDDLGISDCYMEDLVADQMSHSEAIDTITRMYMKHGMIYQVGVEKVSLATTEIHIANALKTRGRVLSVDHGNLVLLRPNNRKLEDRVESALAWPLNNGHLYYSTAIPPRYRDKMIAEMDNFPMFHCDILNMWAYAYDMFKNFRFSAHRRVKVRSVSQIMAATPIRSDF